MTTYRCLASVRFPNRALSLAATALLASMGLLACGGGLDMSNSDLPAPAVSQGEAVVVCGTAAGSATLTLSDVGTGIITGSSGQAPTDRVHLVGTSTGLDPAMHSVAIFLLPLNTDCPSFEQGLATLLANGSFSGDLEFPDDVVTFRAVAVAVPTGTVLVCGSANSCIDAPSYLAQSNALEIRP